MDEVKISLFDKTVGIWIFRNLSTYLNLDGQKFSKYHFGLAILKSWLTPRSELKIYLKGVNDQLHKDN